MALAFDCLPVAAVVNGHFLAVHGGISPEIKNVLDLNRLERVKEPPQMGALCDFLWADPVDNETGLQQVDWMPQRVAGLFVLLRGGLSRYTAVNSFLKANGLITVIRAHEAQFEGFKAYLWQNNDFPQVITLFSAPNYCGCYANKGAVIKLFVSSAEQRAAGAAVQLHAQAGPADPDGRRLHVVSADPVEVPWAH